jgi:hypothetical protein
MDAEKTKRNSQKTLAIYPSQWLDCGVLASIAHRALGSPVSQSTEPTGDGPTRKRATSIFTKGQFSDPVLTPGCVQRLCMPFSFSVGSTSDDRPRSLVTAKLRFLLTWAAISLVFLALTLPTQVVFGTGGYRQCPSSANSTCPNCAPYQAGMLLLGCHQTQTPAYICQSSPSGSCMNFLQQTCTGVQNGKVNCSGMDSDVPCNTNILTCDYSP